jgi:hypothetical protein
MRAYFLILFFSPFVMFSQSQQTQPVNGSTDCPTFGKKNSSSKAGLFQYMRTHKPQRVPAPGEQQSVYRTSALPDLQKAQEREVAALKQARAAEKAEARRQRRERTRPVQTVEPVSPVETADATPARKEPTAVEKEPTFAKASRNSSTPIEPAKPIASASGDKAEVEETAISEDASATDKAEAAKGNREKKVRKAAFKAKLQHLFKRDKKPTSRRNVQKCPSF